MTLRRLLSNVIYTGAVNHKGTVYPGEHERIVEQELWGQVAKQLSLRSVHQRERPHRRQESPLRGILYCAACGSALVISSTTKRGRPRSPGALTDKGKEPARRQASAAASIASSGAWRSPVRLAYSRHLRP